MKQVININFQGRVVPIEVSAYEILKNYIDSLSRHFAAEEGKEEIINDIESRIGELFQERIKEGSTCITDDDVNAIIRSMGRPEDFESEDTSSAAGAQNSGSHADNSNFQQQSYANNTTGARRLYRNENEKVIGGVCSGVAAYFNIDVVVVRILFVIFAVFFGIGIIPYIILWIAVPSTASIEIGSARKKLYRDPEEKYIGGVCAGIGHYFGINVWIPRVLFLLPFLSFAGRWGHWGDASDFFRMGFSPGAMLIYIILWLVLPEASSTAEKLEMKGEKVDMNSIKNSVVEEMKGVQQRAQKFGREAAAFAGERGKAFGAEAGTAARRGSRSFGDIIVFIIKLFGYFILGTICFGLVVALFAFGIMAIGVFPMKDFILTGTWQNVYAWGTLLLFIIAPMIGVITWIIRKLTRTRRGSKMLRLSFAALWIAGWVFMILLAASVTKDFRSSSAINEEEVTLVNPAVSNLDITTLMPGQRYSRNRWFTLNPYDNTNDDTAFVRNVSIHIIQSPNDSFRVTMMRLASGRDKNGANRTAQMIPFKAIQRDSLLIIDKSLPINKQDKFRNQRVIVTVYVPVGKKIRVNDNVGWSDNVQFEGPWRNDWESIEFENLESGWDEGVWYTMTKDGLYDQNGKPADNWKDGRADNNDEAVDAEGGDTHIRINGSGITIDANGPNGTYRYEKNAKPATVDSIIRIQQQERTKDSLRKAKEKIEKQLQNLGADPKGATTMTYAIPGHDPLLFLN